MPNVAVRQVTLLVCLSTIVVAVIQSRVIASESTTEHVLFRAVRCSDAALLRDLLRRGTPPDVRDENGTTPLMSAALHGTAEMVELLLEHGADPQVTNDRGATAMIWGAGDAGKVRLLIEHGADPNARSKLGNTPLMVAAASPTGAASVKILLDHGADITAKNERGRTPLNIAASGGDIETVRLVLAHSREEGILDDVLRAAGNAVAAAADNGFDEIAALLLEQGANPEPGNGRSGNGVNRALMAGNTDVARMLILHGVEFDGRVKPDETPIAALAAYTERDDPTIAKLLIERGVDFTDVNRDGHTALTWARMRGHSQLIEALVQAGTPEGESPPRPEIPSRSVPSGGDKLTKMIVDSVQKSVDLLQRSSDRFLEERRNCVSCHHQNLPGVAFSWARDRGFYVSQATVDRMLQRQVDGLHDRIDRIYEMDSPVPVPPRLLGWGMWSFAELGYRPDELTRAVSWYLAALQQPDGRWSRSFLRPPMGGNEIIGTMLALRTLQLYPVPGREVEMAERIDRARRWLEQAKPESHVDEFSRMIGLAWAGAEPAELVDEVQRLRQMQREDGGWSQLPGLESDAWATGQALLALATAGGVPTNDPAYRRGLAMLLRTQFDDGSWYVQSRSLPFQPYFESAFPFGRDQWVSAPGTAWAVMALVLAVDPDDVARLNPPRVAESVSEPSLHRGTASKELVPAATRTVDFAKDIRPLLARSCLGCHGETDAESNFSLTSRAAMIRGGDSELPAVLPGDSAKSPLVRFAAGIEPDLAMPPLDSNDKYPALTDQEIGLLRAWIDQGADWPAAKNGSTE